MTRPCSTSGSCWRQALAAAEVARHEPSPRLHALIALREAAAHTQLGDADAFRTAITQARRELDRGPHPADPPWCGFVMEPEVAGHEATGNMRLGNADRSITLYENMLDDGRLSPRNRVCWEASLAGALLDAGNREQALARGHTVLSVVAAGKLTSSRPLARLRTLRGAAEQAGDEEFYLDAYAESIASGSTFESAEASMARFDAYTSRDGFGLVIGYLHGEPVGQSWGWPLAADTAWWRGLPLLVRPDNTAAYQAYTRWGWHRVAELRPGLGHCTSGPRRASPGTDRRSHLGVLRRAASRGAIPGRQAPPRTADRPVLGAAPTGGLGQERVQSQSHVSSYQPAVSRDDCVAIINPVPGGPT